MKKLLQRIERAGEKTFIFFGIVLLPLWFPLLMIWVLWDPFYRIELWRKRAGHTKSKIQRNN